MVDLALDELPPPIPHELIYCRIPLVDGAGNSQGLLRLAIQATTVLLNAKVPTLISCSQGLSRSPAIAAAALATRDRVHPQDALRRIMDARHLDVTSGLWQDVQAIVEAGRS